MKTIYCLTVLWCGIASAQMPITGCQPVNPTKNSWYIDPVNGTAAGDGSQGKPWQTLQAVVAAKLINGQDATKGKVHAGDIVYLLTGNHGSVTLTTYTGQFVNTDFITIQAAPGNSPIMNQLVATGVSNWVFRGITFQCPATVPQYFDLIKIYTSSNVLIDGNTIYSVEDTSSWTPAQWLSSAANEAILLSGCTATTLSNNSISNVRYGIGLGGDNIVCVGNKIDRFADDALDFTSSNTLIQRNTITNHYGQVADGNHNDGMQGWTVGGVTNTNVVIDSNIVISSTGTSPGIPAMPTGTGEDFLQGISIFDGVWNNVIVTNNVVVATAYHGIGLGGLSDSKVMFNTVVGLNPTPTTTWIGIFPNKDTTPPSNVLVRNNLAQFFSLNKVGVTDDHNLSLTVKGNAWSAAPSDAIVDLTKVFVSFNQAAGKYDLHLAPGSPAIGSGVSTLLDLAGSPRETSVGAYGGGK